MNERLQRELEEVRRDVNTLGVRLTLAQAWVGFLNYAYDALLHNGVNYRSLPEYSKSTELDDSQKLPVTEARNKITHWLGSLQSAVGAAVRRKAFVLHDSTKE